MPYHHYACQCEVCLASPQTEGARWVDAKPKSPPRKVKRRKSVTRLREKLIKLYGMACCWCGQETTLRGKSSAALFCTVEHLVRLADGGGHNLENCRIACRKCNVSRKHAGETPRIDNEYIAPPHSPRLRVDEDVACWRCRRRIFKSKKKKHREPTPLKAEIRWVVSSGEGLALDVAYWLKERDAGLIPNHSSAASSVTAPL